MRNGHLIKWPQWSGTSGRDSPPLPHGTASASALLTVLPRPGIKKFSEIQFNRNVSSASIVLRIIRNDNDKQRVLGQGSAAAQKQQQEHNQV